MQQTKKSGKFACSLCGQKQSQQRVSTSVCISLQHVTPNLPFYRMTSCLQVYASSAFAKDVRLVVQQLNAARSQAPENASGPPRASVSYNPPEHGKDTWQAYCPGPKQAVQQVCSAQLSMLP